MTTHMPAASRAEDVPAAEGPTKAEYARMAARELGAFLDLLEQLEPGDWAKPTACTLWTVRDVVAHQGGHIQSGAGLWGLLAQSNPLALRAYRKRGMPMLDGMNQKQVDMRRGLSPAELMAELREGTPRSIAARTKLNPVAGAVRVPVHPVGMMPVKTLLHRIFPRDMWIHRLDIADATARPFVATAEHDGTLAALAVADCAKVFQKREPDLGLTLRIAGPAGGEWSVGSGKRTHIDLEMTLEDFLRRSSERVGSDALLGRVRSSAPDELTLRALESLLAPY